MSRASCSTSGVHGKNSWFINLERKIEEPIEEEPVLKTEEPSSEEELEAILDSDPAYQGLLSIIKENFTDIHANKSKKSAKASFATLAKVFVDLSASID